MGLALNNKNLILELYNDDELKELMLIPEADRRNIAKIRDVYISTAFGSDTIITTEPCRILYRNISLAETNNINVKRDNIVFEIYVKASNSYIGLEKRDELIAERLYQILARKYVGDLKFEPEDKGQLYCSEAGYSRYFIKFWYKTIF
jgi:hypothetical protein